MTGHFISAAGVTGVSKLKSIPSQYNTVLELTFVQFSVLLIR